MIISKHNTPASWILLIVAFAVLFQAVIILLDHFSIINLHFSKSDKKYFFVFMVSLGSVFLYFLILISAFLKRIVINHADNTILFQNLITRKTTQYFFSDFDGVIDTYLHHRNFKTKQYKVFGLVKGKIVIRYVDSFWCSNYEEIRSSLNDLDFLGVTDFGYYGEIKLLLGRAKIDSQAIQKK